MQWNNPLFLQWIIKASGYLEEIALACEQRKLETRSDVGSRWEGCSALHPATPPSSLPLCFLFFPCSLSSSTPSLMRCFLTLPLAAGSSSHLQHTYTHRCPCTMLLNNTHSNTFTHSAQTKNTFYMPWIKHTKQKFTVFLLFFCHLMIC